LYKRILLKLSGEALAGEDKVGIDEEVLKGTCASIKQIHDLGIQVAIVVGGGNFWRGKYGQHMERNSADYMGMLATMMNSIALQDTLKQDGIEVSVQSALDMHAIADTYTHRETMKALESGKVVIFACGTGNPFFSTDTCAALRAAQIEAEIILVAKTVDGIYSADPNKDPNAIKYDHISYKKILEDNLTVMDLTAITLCKDNNIPLKVFAMKDSENIIKAVNGEDVGTLVDAE